MLYELLFPLHRLQWFSWLNVLRYVPFRVILATTTAMFLSFMLSPWFIARLQAGQIGQVVRDDGPASHKIKQGTPTMGGALILTCLLVPTLMWADVHNVFVWATTAVTVGYGVLGFLDDYLKIRMRNSKGVPARYKLLGQTVIGGGVLAAVFFDQSRMPADWWEIRGRLSLPFVAFAKHPIEVPVPVYFVFALLVVVAMSNAVNLTDGLDGLAIGPVMTNAATYLAWSYLAGATFGMAGMSQKLVFAKYLDIAPIASVGELAVYCGAMVGAGIGFLWYNTYPAQVFMGDVGSLSLGGGLGMCAIFTKNEVLSIILGGVFFIEAVSVIIQVAWFKRTGKRIFLMAPIHHHFEKKGWPEPKVIVRFWIVSILLALVALSSIKLR